VIGTPSADYGAVGERGGAAPSRATEGGGNGAHSLVIGASVHEPHLGEIDRGEVAVATAQASSRPRSWLWSSDNTACTDS
jgi:hypothetical protein